MIKEDVIEGIVALPSKLFYGTGIPGCILILNRNKPENRRNKRSYSQNSIDSGFASRINADTNHMHMRAARIIKVNEPLQVQELQTPKPKGSQTLIKVQSMPKRWSREIRFICHFL